MNVQFHSMIREEFTEQGILSKSNENVGTLPLHMGREEFQTEEIANVNDLHRREYA